MKDDEYRTVWVDKDDYVWVTDPNAIDRKKYGPFIEHKLVPANAIVIERSELPKVATTSPGIFAVGGIDYYSGSAEHFEWLAMRYLALAEHLREYPPVDEAQVDALKNIVRHLPAWLFAPAHPGGYTELIETVTRHLIDAGVRVESEEEDER